MRKLNKLALSVALAAGTSIATAGSLTGPSAPVNFGAEMSAAGEQSLVLDKGAIIIELGRLYRANDELTLTLANGAEFSETGFLLFGSGAGSTPADLDDSSDWLFGESTSTSVTFIALNALAQNSIFYLSSSTGTTLDEVELDVLAGTAGASAVISATHAPESGANADTYAASAELYGYVTEFTASVSGLFNAVIDAEDEGRKEFVGNISDAIDLSFADSSTQTDILSNTETVVVTLAGDMTGIGSVLLQEGGGGTTATGTIDLASNTATIRASAADIFNNAATVDSVLEITPFGTLNAASGVVMAPRTFTISASLEVGSGSNALITGAAAGALTTNGASARIAQMSLGYGFVQWVKVANLATTDAPITADITVGGTTYQDVDLGITVAANSVATISGADIEAALLNAGGPDVSVTPADVSLLINVPVNQSSVEFHSEKKGTDGRTITNVITS
jgi:hypothetical protein